MAVTIPFDDGVFTVAGATAIVGHDDDVAFLQEPLPHRPAMIAARPADELIHATPAGRAVEHDDRGERALSLRLAHGGRDVDAVLRLDPGLHHRRVGFTHHVDIFLVGQRVVAAAVTRDRGLRRGAGCQDSRRENEQSPAHDQSCLRGLMASTSSWKNCPSNGCGAGGAPATT